MKIMPKHLIIALTLVALFSMMTLMGDNVEYLSIVTERSGVAKSVSSGRVDIETIKTDYENCIYRMQRLEERSEYGFLLSCIDSMNAGKIVITLLILGETFITLIAILVLGVALQVKVEKEWKRMKRMMRMMRRANARKNHSGKYSTAKKQRVKAHRTHPSGKYVA